MTSDLPLTSQQKTFTTGGLETYKRLVSGDSSWARFTLVELLQLISLWIPGAIGLGVRSLLAPLLFHSCGKRPAIGHGVTLRGVHQITLGDRIILDDFSTLDAREESSISIGDSVSIGRNSIVSAKGGAVTLQRGVNVGSHCRIATQSAIEIGESTLIAAYCYIGPGNHIQNPSDGTFISGEMDIKGGVTIGRNVWIGTRATILDGVTIGEGAIVGAHSLVTRNVAPGETVAGCPAKPIHAPSESSEPRE